MEITTIGPFLDHHDRVKERTRRLLEVIPGELLEHRARPGRFSPGDLARHIAGAERWMFVENACGRPSRYPGHGVELAEGLRQVLDYYDRLRVESRAALAVLGPDDLTARCQTVGGARISVWKWLRAMIEHEVHHRGQIYQILGDAGVPTPPIYGLTEPEVRAASVDTRATPS